MQVCEVTILPHSYISFTLTLLPFTWMLPILGLSFLSPRKQKKKKEILNQNKYDFKLNNYINLEQEKIFICSIEFLLFNSLPGALMITFLSLIHPFLPHFFYRSTTLNESDIIMPNLIGFSMNGEKGFEYCCLH